MRSSLNKGILVGPFSEIPFGEKKRWAYYNRYHGGISLKITIWKLFSPAPRGDAHRALFFRTPFATDRVKSGQLQLGVQNASSAIGATFFNR
jgi:hypothetical protein